jgi:tRNA threonylcarbamoyl adenosine modification protein (Sua5/YciO/YrdC/YwlC family)
MNPTEIVTLDSLNPHEAELKKAARLLSRGRLVIIPTETVYGIAANMHDQRAVERLYEIKKRPKEKPFTLHIEDKAKVEEFAKDIPIAAYKLIEAFWPGPLTIILKSKTSGSIGLRMPDNEIALKIIAYAKVPIVCPSANISGQPAPFSFAQAIKDLDGLVDFAIDAGSTRFKAESSVVDLTVEPALVMREKAISKQEIEAVAKRKIVLFVCTGNSCRSVMAQWLLEKKLKELGRLDVEVLSAGIMMGGLSATEATRRLLAQEGIDVSKHRSQRITKDLIRKSDIILVMERRHEEGVLEIAPQAKNRVFLLKEFAKIKDNDLDIADPISKSDEFYTGIFSLIKDAVDTVAKLI